MLVKSVSVVYLIWIIIVLHCWYVWCYWFSKQFYLLLQHDLVVPEYSLNVVVVIFSVLRILITFFFHIRFILTHQILSHFLWYCCIVKPYHPHCCWMLIFLFWLFQTDYYYLIWLLVDCRNVLDNVLVVLDMFLSSSDLLLAVYCGYLNSKSYPEE